MTLEDKLRLHLADKTVTWRHDVPGALVAAAWRDPDPHLVVAHAAAPTAAQVVDAYMLAKAENARLTLLLAAAPNPVAQRSIARFGIATLDAAALPDAAPAPEPRLAPAPEASPLLLAAPEPELSLPTPAEAPLLPAPEPALLVEAPASEPAAITLTTHVEIPLAPPPLVEEGRLPWDLDAPRDEATLSIEVSAAELAALPWHAHAPLEEHVEIITSAPRQRGKRATERPTLTNPKDWGLSWRPTSPSTSDALAIHDPSLWHNAQRVHAIRDQLDQRKGAASFGTLKPDSPWLRKIQE